MSVAAEKTAPGEIAVRLTGVSKTFGGVRALDDVSIEVLLGRDPCAARRERRRQIDDSQDPERRPRPDGRTDRGLRRAARRTHARRRQARRHRHDLPGNEPRADLDRGAEHLPQQRNEELRSASSTTNGASDALARLFESLGVEIDPQARSGRSVRGPAPVHGDRQGDLPQRPCSHPRRADDRALGRRGRETVHVPSQAQIRGRRDHLRLAPHG